MIRYCFDYVELDDAVARQDARWRVKASERTARIVKARRYNERSAIWSVVKPVYMKLQHYKCAYCEKALESIEYGKIEHDLEHFRPKSTVSIWPNRFNFNTGGAYSSGYYWLAYDLQNYLAACKACNTAIKGVYFPIAGRRSRQRGGSSALEREIPYLCYPLGREGDDPEKIVTFIGTAAVPAARSGPRHRRARVIIDFFKLNERESLHAERATLIVLLGAHLEKSQRTPRDKKVIESVTKDFMPHANCCRSFARLWREERTEARKILEGCREYLVSRDLANLA